MKIILVIFLLAFVPLPLQSQDFFESMMRGYQIGQEQKRRELQNRILQQEVEMNKIRTESMHRQNEGQLENIFQEGYKKGYKQGTDDFYEYLKQSYDQLKMDAVRNAAKDVFLEQSTDILLNAKKVFSELALKNPNDYAPRVYNLMIDERLKQLGYKTTTGKKKRK